MSKVFINMIDEKRVKYIYFILLMLLANIALLPFMGVRAIGYLELMVCLLLMSYSLNGIINSVSAWYLTILGYSIFGFFDVYKTLILNNYLPSPTYKYVVLLTTLSLMLFMVVYVFPKNNKNKKNLLSNRKIYINKGLWITILFCMIVIYYGLSHPVTNLEFLLSFLAKAFLVLVAWYGLARKKYYLVLLALIGMYFVHTEISRRVYIVLFFMLVAVWQAGWKKNKRPRASHKVMMVGVLVSLFLFSAYLRSSFNYGEGYVEGDPMQSTINYIYEAKAVDVFENTDYVVSGFPRVRPYYFGETYFALFVQFIPRSIWYEKWVSFGAHLALLKRYGIKEFDNKLWERVAGGFSYSTGFVGEAYANFGLIGVLIMSILLGLVAKAYDRYMSLGVLIKNVDMLPMASFYGAFILVSRGDLLMATYFSLLYCIFIWVIIKSYEKFGFSRVSND